jgi:hypothetical protein
MQKVTRYALKGRDVLKAVLEGILLVGAGLLFAWLFASCSKDSPTAPTTVAVDATPDPCACSRGAGVIRTPNGELTDRVTPNVSGYSATLTTWLNSRGQVLPDWCDWSRSVIWTEIVNGACNWYGSTGDPSLRFECAVPTNVAIAKGVAIVNGQSCYGEIRFKVGQD